MSVNKGKKILLVDDDLTIAEMYSERLEVEGYELVISHDGESGLAAAKAEKPDLILLDIMMPKMNGLDVAKALKDEPAVKNVPIVFLTALLQDADKVNALTSGDNQYIVKSETTPGELVVKVAELLAGKKPKN